MNDVIVQFAVLWGLTIGSSTTPEELERAKEMKEYDSEELLKMFQDWSAEYLYGKDAGELDTVEFFEKKLKELFSTAEAKEKTCENCMCSTCCRSTTCQYCMTCRSADEIEPRNACIWYGKKE